MKNVNHAFVHISACYVAGDADPALLVFGQSGSGSDNAGSKEFMRVVYSKTAGVEDVMRNLKEIARALEANPSLFAEKNSRIQI